MGLIRFITNLFSSGRSGSLIEDDPEFRRLLEFDNTSVDTLKTPVVQEEEPGSPDAVED